MNYSKFCLIFIINLLIAILILYKITDFSLKWVDFYTKHGSYVVVPNLRDLTLDQSIDLLKKLGLKYDVDTSRYDPYFKPYQVISFSPEAGDHVKIGRHIYLQANAKTFQSTATVLPNIINKNKRTAIKLLQSNHIFVKKIKYIMINDPSSKDIVLKVFYQGKSIKSGHILPNQDSVTLLIGKGYEKNNFVIVPNVIGMDLHTATSILKEKSFNIINFYYDHSSSDTYDNNNQSSSIKNEAKVYRQNPYPGNKIHQNKKYIEIWITSSSTKKKNNSKPKELLENLIQSSYEIHKNEYHSVKNNLEDKNHLTNKEKKTKIEIKENESK
ncbi:PASTA domain-containing protein [Blattabacterium cuenoti]|uniref:PASTA domain-containing protein n=1 Tax=Blattabacterium cuenoti TaxID=1653831 RepID=UPI00163D07D3|nr:PASTA domain-containing protein [Blattabacterium cuenoti]